MRDSKILKLFIVTIFLGNFVFANPPSISTEDATKRLGQESEVKSDNKNDVDDIFGIRPDEKLGILLNYVTRALGALSPIGLVLKKHLEK